MEELLVDAFVTAAAIAGSEFGGDDKSVMVFLFLPGRGLVALKAIDALFGVGTHLIFMNDRILRAGVALGALSCGTDEIRSGLLCIKFRAGAIDEEGRDDESKGDDDCDEDGTK
jgi:hypothetical protein